MLFAERERDKFIFLSSQTTFLFACPLVIVIIMYDMSISEETREKLLVYQRDEITEHHVYKRLARTAISPENRRILEKIADDELNHYRDWRTHTEQDVSPNKLKVWKYFLISKIFGMTFGIKLMEKEEVRLIDSYEHLRGTFQEVNAMIQDEKEHENLLITLLEEERLRYLGSMVLGLNDALVELTGALAGLTLAFQNTKLIALAGLIMGIAAAMSMGASEYLSKKTEGNIRNPVTASIYTGIAYIVTVFILILPYLLFENLYLCLACTLGLAFLVIAIFNYYISVVNDVSFKKRFFEMASLSLIIAMISFIIGYLIRSFLGVEI